MPNINKQSITKKLNVIPVDIWNEISNFLDFTIFTQLLFINYELLASFLLSVFCNKYLQIYINNQDSKDKLLELEKYLDNNLFIITAKEINKEKKVIAKKDISQTSFNIKILTIDTQDNRQIIINSILNIINHIRFNIENILKMPVHYVNNKALISMPKLEFLQYFDNHFLIYEAIQFQQEMILLMRNDSSQGITLTVHNLHKGKVLAHAFFTEIKNSNKYFLFKDIILDKNSLPESENLQYFPIKYRSIIFNCNDDKWKNIEFIMFYDLYLKLIFYKLLSMHKTDIISSIIEFFYRMLVIFHNHKITKYMLSYAFEQQTLIFTYNVERIFYIFLKEENIDNSLFILAMYIFEYNDYKDIKKSIHNLYFDYDKYHIYNHIFCQFFQLLTKAKIQNKINKIQLINLSLHRIYNIYFDLLYCKDKSMLITIKHEHEISKIINSNLVYFLLFINKIDYNITIKEIKFILNIFDKIIIIGIHDYICTLRNEIRLGIKEREIEKVEHLKKHSNDLQNKFSLHSYELLQTKYKKNDTTITYLAQKFKMLI